MGVLDAKEEQLGNLLLPQAICTFVYDMFVCVLAYGLMQIMVHLVDIELLPYIELLPCTTY